jgi:hypothetical protein
MRYGFVLLGWLAAAAAAAPSHGRPDAAIAVTAKRLSLDQIAKASRPSAPRRVIYARPHSQGRA